METETNGLSRITSWNAPETRDAQRLRTVTLCLTVACAVAVTGHARTTTGPAAEVAGRRVALERTVGGARFRLHGTAVLKKGWVFSVYAAALYLGAGAQPGRVLEDVPKRLEIYYLHRTPKRHMIATAERTLKQNLKPGELAALQPSIDRLHAAYEDGRKGGTATLTYTPGTGTVFAIDGREKVRIPGASFAAAYFGVWLGATPSSESVKRQLLTKWRK